MSERLAQHIRDAHGIEVADLDDPTSRRLMRTLHESDHRVGRVGLRVFEHDVEDLYLSVDEDDA